MKSKLSTKMIHHVLLTGITLLLLFLPLGRGMLFGSEGDWYSQHVAIAESLRQTMLETGKLIPQYIRLGGGSSIYDFAYYGLLRPDILISCLLSDVSMKYIIAVYAVLEILLCVNLCYEWLVSRKIRGKFAFAGGLLLATSTCFYQAHHQIVFVNYLPFLVLALIGVDRLLEKKKRTLLMISLFLIYIHSFYYAISCLLVVIVYCIHGILQRNDLEEMVQNREWRMLIAKLKQPITGLICSIILSIGMAMVLLLPTGLDILSTSKDAGSFTKAPVKIVDLGMRGILYSPYGCGMTLVTLYCLLLSVTKRGKRFLAAEVLLAMSLPVVSYVLNGFLYSRPKVLIPFVVLLAYIVSDTLKDLYLESQKHSLIVLLLCFIPAFFSVWKVLILVDGLLLWLWIAFQKSSNVSVAKKVTLFWTVLLVPLFVSLGVNFSASYLEPVCKGRGMAVSFLKAEDKRQEHFTAEEIEGVVMDSRYRFDILANNFVNSNLLADGKINKTAMYSSITNAEYAEFYYDTMKNAVSVNNRVALVPGKNPCFAYIMGMKYVLADADNIPYGYKTVLQKSDYVLAQNNDVLPICYGTTDLMGEDVYKTLEFPETIEALCRNAVVNKTKGEIVKTANIKNKSDKDRFVSHMKKENIQTFLEKKDVEILLHPSGEQETYTFPLRQPLRGKCLIISFYVESRDGEQVVISINGVKNKLSSKNAPYPNQNNEFTYILSVEDGCQELMVEVSKGEYTIENLSVYTVDEAYLKHKDVTVPMIKQADSDNGRNVFTGSIDMKKDGYFITSYPYRKGYQITLDGQAAGYEKVNTAFVGFPVTAGAHEIEITYQAPGFKMGILVSVLAWILFAGVIIWEERNRDNN